MRIITGSARGTTLKTLPGEETRPTAERVKEAMFSAVQFELGDRSVLELFGGCGQLSLEALSRGAESATIVDASRAACLRSGEPCWWWLRSPGTYKDYVSDVFIPGNILGNHAVIGKGGVRPAMWLYF